MRHIVWLRNELRLHDNPALYHAALDDSEVLPVFIWPDKENLSGAASKWWLHQSLSAFSASLQALDGDLFIFIGAAEKVLSELAKRHKADAVFWSRAYDPAGRALDDSVEQALRHDGVNCRIFAGANLLVNPAEVWSKSGTPFKVFTPFYKQAAVVTVAEPLPCPNRLKLPGKSAGSVKISRLGLEPKSDWASGFRETWRPGEAGARKRLEKLLDETLKNYGVDRDFPGQEGTSRLSPHLHFGEISPRTVFHEVRAFVESQTSKSLYKQEELFVRQIYWREFAHHLLHHFPHMTDKPMYSKFEQFPWREDEQQLRAWQRGETGYPIVDAGMHELWTTGWMHNRVRMIVGSFLVKDLLLPWQAGATWFWDTLVDADGANNTLGWQWIGGCGPDAAPYFRVFNPVLQSKRFDPEGVYIKRWLPQLRSLSGEALHAPWTGSPALLKEAGVVLDDTYPGPLVDHRAARIRALEAYEVIKGAARE